nr:60kDa protein [Agapanthus velarivirus]
MDIRSSPAIRKLFSRLLYKPDPTEELRRVATRLKNEKRSNVALSYMGNSARTTKSFYTNVTVTEYAVTVPDETILTCLTLFIYYLTEVEGELYKLYSPYPPANLLMNVGEHASLTYKDRFVGRSITDMCHANPTAGCTFTYSSVREKHPELTETEVNLLYKVQNAFGREIGLKELGGEEMKLFRINRKEDVTTKLVVSALEIIKQAMMYVETYFKYTEDELLMLSKQSKTLIYSAPYFGLSESAQALANSSIICKGALYKNFDEFRKIVSNEENLTRVVKHFNKHIAPVLTKLFKLDFYSSLNKIVKHEMVSAEGVMTDKDTLSAFLSDIDLETKYSSTIHKLDDVSDKIIYDRCHDFFKTRFGINSAKLSEALTLLFFSFMNTSPAIRARNEWFCVEFEYSGELKRVEFKSKEFISYIDGVRDKLSAESQERNYIRLYCSKRANKAIKVNTFFNFTPKLFFKYANILGHMRIDFYKGLDPRNLTLNECQSLHTLQVVTEYRTNSTGEARNSYLETIGLI